MVASFGPAVQGNARTQEAWRPRAAMLLDEIGPSILVTHGDSSAWAWLAADDRPKLVRGIVAVEPVAAPFEGQAAWGLSAARMSFDPARGDQR